MNVTQVTPFFLELESTSFCLMITEVYVNIFMSYTMLTTQNLLSIKPLKSCVWFPGNASFKTLAQIQITFFT